MFDPRPLRCPTLCWGLMPMLNPCPFVDSSRHCTGWSGPVQQFHFEGFLRKASADQLMGLFHHHGNFQQWNYENLPGPFCRPTLL
jgi:hypothetical protein